MCSLHRPGTSHPSRKHAVVKYSGNQGEPAYFNRLLVVNPKHSSDPRLAEEVARQDIAWQQERLEGVARTFALTIAQLPGTLYHAVGNAYLVCRIADTIEDDPALAVERKQEFSERFISIVAGRGDAESFARELGALLSSATTEAERELIAATPRVARITRRLSRVQQDAILRCVTIMSQGMVEFQRNANAEGLADVRRMNQYCYHVAGIVGETLTTLFCDYCNRMGRQRDELVALSVSFGQGLQMINILKDMWEDQRRGACWLPRDVFGASGCELSSLSPGQAAPGFVEGLHRIVAITHYHLCNALRYTTMIPGRETGIRRSCLWPLGIAVLTLRRIHRMPSFSSGQEVKISRRNVWAVAIITSALARSNTALKILFRLLTRSLPGPVAA